MKKIITSHICPPIPDRSNDWVAFYEDEEEEGLRGWGKTENEAIENLKLQEE